MTLLDITSKILYRDQLIIILNKPPAMMVHPGPKGGESLEDYFEQLRFDYKELPRLAHRLDRDTSGCLVLGRNLRAIRKLGRLFESGQVKKTYWATVEGNVKEEQGVIDLPLAKIKLPKGWSMQPSKKGAEGAQEAVTEYKVLKRLQDGRTFLELSPRTGRTHQIRVHLQSLGHPIVGDWLYGPQTERGNEFPLLHLHARGINIPLYEDKPAIVVEAALPEHMQGLL